MDRKQDKAQYLPISPNKVVVKELTQKQKVLLELIHSNVHLTGKEPSLTFLAKQMDVKLPSVYDHKLLLKAKGYLLGFIYCPYCGVKI